MRIILDGNDGTGKSTVFEKLLKLGLNVKDRGIPTKMTDDPTLRPGAAEKGELYLILDVPVEVSRERLRAAGKDLTEKYHTVEDLTFYRRRYQEVAEVLGVDLIDSSGTPEETFSKCFARIHETTSMGISIDDPCTGYCPMVDADEGASITYATEEGVAQATVGPVKRFLLPFIRKNEKQVRRQVLDTVGALADELHIFRTSDQRIAIGVVTHPSTLEAVKDPEA